MKMNTVILVAVLLPYFCLGVFADSCTKSGDGLTITCQSEFAGQSTSTSIELETCRKEPKVTIKIKVDALGIDFEKTFENSQDVPIPGFTLAGNGVYIGVEITSNVDGNTDLKIKLSLKTIFGKLTSLTLVDEPIIKSTCNDFLYWWNSQNDGIKAGVGGGAALLLVIFIGCCCRCCCKKKTQQGTTIMMVPPPANDPNCIVVNNTTQQQQTMYSPMPPPPPPGNQYGYQKFQ